MHTPPERRRAFKIRPSGSAQLHLELTGLLPPSLNHAYPHVIRRGADGRMVVRRVSSKEMKTYKAQVAKYLLFLGITRGSWAEVKAVAYTAVITVPTAASDLDNRLKALQDAVLGYLGINDNRVVEIHVLRLVDRKAPGVEIIIRPAAPVTNLGRLLLDWLRRWI